MSYETSVKICKCYDGYMQLDFISVNMSLYDGTSNFRSKEYQQEKHEEQLASIIVKEEFEKIEQMDCLALREVFRKTETPKDADGLLIKSHQQLIDFMKESNMYEPYLKRKEMYDSQRELLNRDDLIPVKFQKYTSWETGLSFFILSEKVDNVIFSKLIKSGLYNHTYDEDNEEKFTGYCIDNNEKNILILAKNGIKII